MLQGTHLGARVGIERHGDGAGGDFAGLNLCLGETDGGDFRAGEDGVGHGLQAQRGHALT